MITFADILRAEAEIEAALNQIPPIPRSLEFAVIMAARPHENITVHFDGYIAWFTLND